VDGEIEISPTTLLRECSEDSVGLALVRPISDRLDALVRLAEASGDRTNRKELLAALILEAPSEGATLSDLIRRYRLATVADSRFDDADEDVPLRVTPRRPGPRPRKEAQSQGESG
jgi:hypothetical protein